MSRALRRELLRSRVVVILSSELMSLEAIALEAMRAAVPVAVSSPTAARRLGYMTSRSYSFVDKEAAEKQNGTFASPSQGVNRGQGTSHNAQDSKQQNQDGRDDLVIGEADTDYLMKQVQVVYSNEWRWNRLVRGGLDHVQSCCSPAAMLQGLASTVREVQRVSVLARTAISDGKRDISMSSCSSEFLKVPKPARKISKAA